MSALRLVNGTAADLKSLKPTWELPEAPPRLKKCPTCKRERGYAKFFTATDVPIRRCIACRNKALAAPGGLLGYRNPR